MHPSCVFAFSFLVSRVFLSFCCHARFMACLNVHLSVRGQSVLQSFVLPALPFRSYLQKRWYLAELTFTSLFNATPHVSHNPQLPMYPRPIAHTSAVKLPLWQPHDCCGISLYGHYHCSPLKMTYITIRCPWPPVASQHAVLCPYGARRVFRGLPLNRSKTAHVIGWWYRMTW